MLSPGICYTDTVRPREILTDFDRYLARRGLRLDAVIVGGAALNLLGLVSRPTKDCDVLDPVLSQEVAEAARAFAAEVREGGEVLDDGWLNNEPASLAGQLPAGGRDRLQSASRGLAIELHCLGREDLLRSKLFALCDRGTDLGDCLALAPDETELRALLPWLEQQDAAPGWPAHVRATLAGRARRLGHAF